MTMLAQRPGFMLAATNSGAGKTTITLGLLAALGRQGLSIQPFKCGPDFIDPTLHQMVSGRVSRNLDLRMCGEAWVRDSFLRHGADADIVLVEGVMGLFDGGAASPAALAKTLGLPVLLVVDAKACAESIAAVVKGFETLDPELTLMGVILNRVASARHLELLSYAIRRHCQTPLLGHLPRNPAFAIPDRHLGLMMGDESPLSPEQIDTLADAVTEHIDLAAIVRLAHSTEPSQNTNRLQGAPPYARFILSPPRWQIKRAKSHTTVCEETSNKADKQACETSDGVAVIVHQEREIVAKPQNCNRSAVPQMRERGLRSVLVAHEQADDKADVVLLNGYVRIGIARDQAFCFYYQDNLDLLSQYGAELVPFSPINDHSLPPDLDGLYLGGGYPELHAQRLSENLTMRAAIRAWSAAGRPLYAECGGFLYLCQGLTDLTGTAWDLAGVFPVQARMRQRLASLGYREAMITAPCLFGDQGTLFGHEFHYSEIEEMPTAITRAFRLQDSRTEGYQIKNTLGGYLHLHFGQTPEAVRTFIALCTGGHNR